MGKEIVWLKKYIRVQQEKLGYEVQIFCDISSEAAGAGMDKMHHERRGANGSRD